MSSVDLVVGVVVALATVALGVVLMVLSRRPGEYDEDRDWL